MTELTKEQLIEEAKLKIAIAKCHPNSEMARVEGELFKIALASLEAVSDERAAYELFMEKRFGESVDRRRAKNGDSEYMAWDMALGWIIWCHRATMLQSQDSGIKNGWISCSERMPEMGERQCYVLAADFKNNYPPNIPNTQVGVYGDWFNDGNPTWDDGDGEDLYLKEVTHWMPLPEPPQEVK